ncbi:MAG: hypothetical protein AAB521_00795 [Patescibacteria group bacterium]
MTIESSHPSFEGNGIVESTAIAEEIETSEERRKRVVRHLMEALGKGAFLAVDEETTQRVLSGMNDFAIAIEDVVGKLGGKNTARSQNVFERLGKGKKNPGTPYNRTVDFLTSFGILQKAHAAQRTRSFAQLYLDLYQTGSENLWEVEKMRLRAQKKDSPPTQGTVHL